MAPEELPPLDRDLADLVGAYVDDTELSAHEVENAHARTLTEAGAAGSGQALVHSVLKVALIVGTLGVGVAVLWSKSAPVEGSAHTMFGDPVQRSVHVVPSRPIAALVLEPQGAENAPAAPKHASKPRRSSAPREGSDDLAAELELLRSARRALRSGQPDLALERVARHAKHYPHSPFSEERGATEVMALCKKGLDDEARHKARRFRKKFPRSSFEAGLIAACNED